MLGGMLGLSTTPNLIGKYAFCLASILAGIMLYLLLSVVLVDLVNLGIKLSSRLNGFISVSLTAIVVIYGTIHASSPIVKEVRIPVAGLTKEIKAVHLTDIHLGHFRGKSHIEKITEIVNKINPEVIFHTGDLYDARSVFKEDALEPFSTLKAPHYFVEGNHDNYVDVMHVYGLLKKQGVKILENEVANFGELQIIGLKHMLADKESFDMHAPEEGHTIQEVLETMSIDQAKPTVLLHHSPNGLKYADEKGVDLLLAGHTHGGQMFPLTWIAKLQFKYNAGLYKFNDLLVYVSEGVGTMFSPMRVATNSEITLLQLVPKNDL